MIPRTRDVAVSFGCQLRSRLVPACRYDQELRPTLENVHANDHKWPCVGAYIHPRLSVLSRGVELPYDLGCSKLLHLRESTTQHRVSPVYILRLDRTILCISLLLHLGRTPFPITGHLIWNQGQRCSQRFMYCLPCTPGEVPLGVKLCIIHPASIKRCD